MIRPGLDAVATRGAANPFRFRLNRWAVFARSQTSASQADGRCADSTDSVRVRELPLFLEEFCPDENMKTWG
eukprot:COSAG06_NODE_1298_length_9953_cov_150.245281_7_plen_72_part_00